MRRITLPLTARSILLVTLISVIGSLLAFDQFYIMTAGQPRNMTATSVFLIYLNSFPYLKLGYGAALSLILAAIILSFTVAPDRADAAEAMASRARRRLGDRPTPSRASSRALLDGRTKYLVGAVCILLCTVMLLPLVASVLASLKTTAEAAAVPPTYFPHALSLDSYERLWNLPGRPAALFPEQRRRRRC